MRDVPFPVSAQIADFALTIKAHTRLGASRGGHVASERAPGATWRGALSVVPSATANAVKLRAFIHSLRGRGGSFLLRLPVEFTPLDQPEAESFGGLCQFSDETHFTDDTAFADSFLLDTSNLRPDGKTEFTDTFEFSDGTAFKQRKLFPDSAVSYGQLTGGANVDDDTLSVSAGLAASPRCVVGSYLAVSDFADQRQLFRIVSVDGQTIGVRPRVRKAFNAGALVAIGRVTVRLRLDQDVPAVPLNGQHSSPITINVAEVY